MASNWIKMRSDLHSHPKVVRIVSALHADVCPQSVQLASEKFRVVGGLHAVWSLFDAHSDDGKLVGYTPETLDATLGFPGLARAMAAVNWLTITPQALVLPEFDTHNGQSAKRRAQDADRKKDVRKMSASDADKKRTREEKNREEEKQEQRALAKQKRAAEATLPQWVESLGDAETIAADDPIFEWAAKAGLPREWVALGWWAFESRYMDDSKTYTDWRAVFRRALREDWLRLWRKDARTGDWTLTTTGEQARLEMSA